MEELASSTERQESSPQGPGTSCPSHPASHWLLPQLRTLPAWPGPRKLLYCPPAASKIQSLTWTHTPHIASHPRTEVPGCSPKPLSEERGSRFKSAPPRPLPSPPSSLLLRVCEELAMFLLWSNVSKVVSSGLHLFQKNVSILCFHFSGNINVKHDSTFTNSQLKDRFIS